MDVLTPKNIKTSSEGLSIVKKYGVRGKMTDRCARQRDADVDVEGVATSLITVNLLSNTKYVMQLQRDLFMEVCRVSPAEAR